MTPMVDTRLDPWSKGLSSDLLAVQLYLQRRQKPIVVCVYMCLRVSLYVTVCVCICSCCVGSFSLEL